MNKTLVAAIVVFVALLGAVFVMRSRPQKAGMKELTLGTIARDSVQKLEITVPPKEKPAGHGADLGDATAPESSDKPQHIVLEKTAQGWMVSDPGQPERKFVAELPQVEQALDDIAALRTGELIASKAERHAELEIDEKKGHRVKVTTADGRVADLIFGRPAKSGGSTVRFADKNDVFIAKGRLGNTLKRDLLGWRKKTIVAAKVEELTTITVKPKDGPGFTVVAEAAAPAEPVDGGVAPAPKASWKITAPAPLPDGFRLDDAQVQRVAQTLVGVRAQDYAEGVSDDVTGLAGAHTLIEGATKDGRKIVLHLGNEDDKKRVFARVDGDPQLYLVAQFGAKQAGRTLDELRELTLVSATLEDIERVAFSSANGKTVVEKAGEGWKLLEPKAPPANFDETQIATQVAALLRLKAARMVTVDPKTTGLDKPNPFVELTLKGGKKQLVRFGAGVPEERDPTLPEGQNPEPREYYVSGGADDLTYVIAAFSRRRYDKPLELFKKPAGPPPGMGGMPGGAGGMQGLEGLPPDVRKKLEESLKGMKH